MRALFVSMMLVIVAVPFCFGVSQWSRKYDQPCSYCHTSFPRLNFNGEMFMRNGYQLVDTQDGDDAKKTELNEHTFIGRVEDWFGARINMNIMQVKQDDIVVNGVAETRVDFGQPVWLQFFTAGSVYKNCAVFIETEFQTETSKVKANWYHVSFHNLGGSSYANFRVGHLAPTNWASLTGRLRIQPNINNYPLQGVYSSHGRGEDSVPVIKAVPAVSFFGWDKNFLYEFGLYNGAYYSDPNRNKNIWGTFRYDMASGTNASFHFQYGTDTDDTATAQAENNFYRIMPGVNFRQGDLDIQFAYIYGHDENWHLALDPTADDELTWHGISAVGAAFINPKAYLAAQWDYVNCDDDPAIEHNTFTPGFWYHPRENLKIGFTPQFDLQGEDEAYHPKRKHAFFINLRAMI